MVISMEEFESYNDVGKAFIALQTKIMAVFKTVDHATLRRACIVQMHNPSGAKLSPKLVQQISATQNTDDLFDLLVCCPYWSWIDIRMLEAMVIASGSSQADELLSNYKAVVFSKKLIKLLPNVFSKEAEEDYMKLVTIIQRDPNEMTVGDIVVLQSKLEVEVMDFRKGVSVLEHFQNRDRVKECQLNDPLASPNDNIGKLCNIIVLSCVLLFCHITTVKDFIDHYHT